MAKSVYYALFIFCLATFNINVATGQQSQNNSLNAQLERSGTRQDSILILIDLIEANRYTNPLQAIAYGDIAMDISLSYGDPLTTARINTSLGHVYFDMGIYYEALESYSSALNTCIDRPDEQYIGSCLNNIGKVYNELKIYSLSLKSFDHAASIYKEQDIISGLATSYNNSGITHCHMGNFDIAMQYFNDVLDFNPDSISQELRAYTYSNISKVFLYRGDWVLSKEFNGRAMSIYKRLDDRQAIASAHINLGNIAKQSGDFDAALQEYIISSDIFEEISHRKALAESFLLQAEIYIDTDNNTNAIQLTNQAMALAQEYHFLEVIKDCYLLLSVLYTQLDDIHTAHEYYLSYNLVKDSIYNHQLTNSIAKTETKNTLLQYEINIDKLENERQTERYSKWFILTILLLSLLTVILALSRLFSQRKANRILAHQRNILKQSLTEQQISEKKYKALFSQANDSIFLMDRETFTDCNNKTLEMFGCERDDIVGQPPYKFSPTTQPDGKKSKERALKMIELCNKGQAQRFYWVHTKKDGTPFDAEVSLNMIDLDGKQYIQAIVRNISERVRAEEEMVQAREKAEDATQSKTFFLAKMSHEIRTMLGGITSSAQLLKVTRVDKHQEELLDIIDTSADNLLAIVNEILDLSKIEAGKIDIESRSFNIRKTIENTVNTYMHKAKEKKIALYLSIHPKTPEFIKGDELRLKQILANLLSNSIKFTDAGNVTCDIAVVKEYATSFLLGIKISDTGIGIPENKIKDMFSEYSQSDVSISRRYGGTGLGLTIVYKLVNLMKGTIELRSKLKEGTQFIINLPLEKTEQRIEDNDKAAKVEFKTLIKYTILLAEDNLINQRITTINLQNLGHQVDIAEDGKEAWEKYQQKEYDIILMDIQMPEMDGVEVTHLIRKYEKENPDKGRTRIVAITANILGKDIEYCLAEGMDAYITKPFKIEDIIENLDPDPPGESKK